MQLRTTGNKASLKYEANWVKIMFSGTFDIVGNREIGQCLVYLENFPYLAHDLLPESMIL